VARRKIVDEPKVREGRRNIFGAPRVRYKNRFYDDLKGFAIFDDPLDQIAKMPEVTEASYLEEEPWMNDVTARLADVYLHSDDMPGARTLSDVKLERLSQALALGLRQIEAFKFAGYRVPGPEMLTDRALLHRIAYHRRVGADACAVTSERIVAELAAVAFSKVSDAVDWDGKNVVLKPSNELDPATQRAVASVSEGQFGISLKFHSKPDSLQALMRFKGMDKQKVEVSGPDGKPIEQAITRDMDPRKAAEAYADLLKEGPT
jgi:hypothetical protein